jgi:methylglutaconyl-CoA hydratase
VGSDLVVVTRKRPEVAVFTLNRPAKRNALNIALLRSLCQAAETAAKDSSIRVILLRGNGPVFCAGLDLVEGRDISVAGESAELVARTLLLLHESPKVTIAAAHGAAIAGGAGLLLACDLAVAAADLQVGFTEVRRGLAAGLIMTLIRRRMRESDARELLLTGELVDGSRALRMGIVNRVVPAEGLLQEALAMAESVIQGGPQALQATKHFFQSLWPSSLADDLGRALQLHTDVRTTAEAQEGMRAFAEKRPPKWDSD